MDEKNVMESLLETTKGLCDLYMHGTVESSTPQVRGAFNAALNEALNMQESVYNDMAARGWYAPAQAEGVKRGEVKQKFSCC